MSIEIKNVSKSFGKKTALKNINICFENGIYGLLGPNGAGKTTLINIMVTALLPSKGQVLYNGKDIHLASSDYLSSLGFLPQMPKFYSNYTAEEFLKYMAALKNIKTGVDEKIEELLDLVNLSSERKNKIGTFSGGMKQRIGIAQALLNDPKVLILDEPTAGLDPKERIRFRNLISKIAGNRTVILATHIVPDVEHIANKVIFLKDGEVCKTGAPISLMDEISKKVWSVKADAESLEKYLLNFLISSVRREENEYELRIVNEEKPCENAVNTVPDLEDVFLYYIGETEL